MTRLAFFLPDLSGGGAERMMVNLAQGVVAQGVELDLVLTSARGPFLRDVPSQAELIDLRATSVSRSVPGLVRYLRRRRPEVLLSTLQHANVAAVVARQLAGVRTRVFLREANMLSVGRSSSFKRRAVGFWVRRLYTKADGVVAVSEGVARDLRQVLNVSPEKVNTVYNPVVTADLYDKRQADVEHPWLGADQPVFLGVGRLEKQKDFATLIRAFALVRRQREAKLVILGEGAKRPELLALAKDLGISEDVDLPGFVDNPFAFMSGASVFVLSSAWEGLPGVLIQALACGCPVVSTDCPSGPSEVLEGGRYGELVPVGDVEAMAAAMVQTLKSPLERELLERRARDFSVEASTRAYLTLFGVEGADITEQ